MENYLYLLELFVETITFSSNLPEYPKPYEVVVSGEVGKFLKMDVFSIQSSTIGANEPHKELHLNSGRSNLFSCNPDELLQKIDENPFIIHLIVKQKPIAVASLGWTKDFYNLIKKAPETYGIAGPVVMQDQFLLTESGTDRIMGDIKAAVRLSSFGTNIQTSFQLISSERDTHKRYLVKGARGEATFECQKLVDGTSGEIIPLTSIFTNEPNQIDEISLMALFKSTLDPKCSVTPDEFNVAISSLFNPKTPSNLTFDIISLVEKPEENKYIDLRIRGGSKGFVFEVEPFNLGLDTLPTDLSDSASGTEREQPPLSIDEINRYLCKHKDCPAARKFKEFGIGPLAKTSGLGGVYKPPSLPATYGMSQTYGVFDEYGPYGLFSRPKRPSNPFIPKKDCDWASSCWAPKRKRQDKREDYRTKPPCGCLRSQYNTCMCLGEEKPPLRLTGGGVLDFDDVKSPFHECKEIMDQFDEVLAKYKKALGPCGKATCPFAPNVTKESCKKMCPAEMSAYSQDKVPAIASAPFITIETPKKKHQIQPACGSPKCAYAKHKTGLIDEDAEMELQYLPSAPSGKCGHPKCPYPVEPELPPIHWDCPEPLPKGKCKNPDCPYLPKEIKCLNAVLAKGPCGNFNCPFAPPAPCDSPFCPFASKECPYQKEQADTISVCSNPDCPFARKGADICDNPDCPYAERNDICDNPNCPYAEKTNVCPYAKKQDTFTCPPPGPPCYYPPCGDNPCVIPPCYIQNLLAYLCGMGGNTGGGQVCSGVPECPYMPKQTQKPNVCSSPTCPFQPKPKERVCGPTCKQVEKKPSPCYAPVESACGNPNCPYAKKVCDKDESPKRKREEEGGEAKEGDIEYHSETRISVDNEPCWPETCKAKGGNLICDSCPCSEGADQVDDVCENPECPYAPKTCYKKPSPCYMPPPRDDVCENPDCPFSQKSPCGSVPPPCPGNFPPCMFPPGPCGMDPLQALLAYCMPITVCPDGPLCPYPAKNALQICLGGSPCGVTAQQPQPCAMKQKSDQPKKEKGDAWDGDALEEGSIEYKSETRISMDLAPCTQKTCQSAGGDLVCDVCPCTKSASETGKMKKTEGKGDAWDGAALEEGAIEYKSETRISMDLAPCTQKTCKSTGGKLVCDVCPCTKSASETRPGKKKKTAPGSKSAPALGAKGKKRKSKSKYVYSIGDKYPGVQIGHRECVMPGFNVPPKMGWLWNIHTPCLRLKPRRGWRPGAIARTIAERIRKHREAQGLQMLELKHMRKGKKGYGMYDSGTSVNVQPKPTLQIKKHDGCYWITMNPLKDPHTLVENENPYMDCTPLQFKIMKNKDKSRAEGENGNEYRSCFCEDDGEQQTSSSESELEIEFTPPAGIIHPERFKKKRNVVHCDTQYLAADFEKKSEAGKSSKKGKKGKKDKKGKGKGKKGGKKGKKK